MFGFYFGNTKYIIYFHSWSRLFQDYYSVTVGDVGVTSLRSDVKINIGTVRFDTINLSLIVCIIKVGSKTIFNTR